MDDYSPEQLIHGGEHFDHLLRDVRCRIINWEASIVTGEFPREILHDIIADKGLKRPTPVRWQKRTSKK